MQEITIQLSDGNKVSLKDPAAIYLGAYLTWAREARAFGTLWPCVSYRGHGCAPPRWKLLPTLCRSCYGQGVDNPKRITLLKQAEGEIILEFSSRFGLSQKKQIEILAYAQHHGAPTRLLDWTLNPLVGLWFAVSEKQYDAEPGIVFQLRAGPEHGICMARDCDLDHFDNGKCKFQVHVMSSPAFIDRGNRQRGVFSVVGYSSDSVLKPLDEIANTSVRSFPIPKEFKASLRRLLTEVGIDPFTMFGSPDSVGESWALRLDLSDLLLSPEMEIKS
jgi:hypothetical protein